MSGLKELERKEFLDLLKEILKEIQEGSFEGIIVVGSGDKSFSHAFKGEAEDRVKAVDLIFYSMSLEPSLEAKEYFLEEMYTRFKTLFGEAFLEEIDQIRSSFLKHWVV